MRICKEEWNVNSYGDLCNAMYLAAERGHEHLVRLCKSWGVTTYHSAMGSGCGGKENILRLFKEWGGENFNGALRGAAAHCHVHLLGLCKEWGATDFVAALDATRGQELNPNYDQTVLVLEAWIQEQ